MRVKLLFMAILMSSTVFGHKFYVSIADLKYDEEQNRIEGSLKMTAHDFEDLLSNKFEREIDLEEVADTSKVGRYVQTYLAKHFEVYSGGKRAIPNYLGKEITLRQELFFYFTFTQVVNPKEIKVVNTLLFEMFPKQQNIVHYRFKEQTKSVTLVPLKTHEKIKFD